MCPDCGMSAGHKWWCRTARWNRKDYKVKFANGRTLSGHLLKACDYGAIGSIGGEHQIEPPRSQKHLDPKKLAKTGGRLTKV